MLPLVGCTGWIPGWGNKILHAAAKIIIIKKVKI